MRRRRLLLYAASLLATGTLAGSAARAGDVVGGAVSDDEQQLTTLLIQVGETKAAMKQLLAGSVERGQMDPLFQAAESFVKNYSRMAMMDSSAYNDGVLSGYLNNKLIPQLEAMGAPAQATWLVDEIRDWTRLEITIEQFRQMGVSETAVSSDVESAEGTDSDSAASTDNSRRRQR